MDSVIIESTEPSTSKIVSQLSKDEVPIQPCANFLTPFKENFLSNTGPISSSMTSLENDHSSGSTGSLWHFQDVSDNLESDELTRSSVFSTRESTSSPAPKVFQTTPLSRKPLKKKNYSTELESSLILLCQTMHQRFQDNHNSEVIGGPDETFARLIVNQLERLSSYEKQKRQQVIMQILYAPYDS
ncbi:uncharacterized protein LOC116853461 [Odontomachus brunneus]|uniref:uncharacterized protein LOC116853461 n=1 Tax=Odontomachus brunneus TaxID=486640 RepID=UPI0013F27BF6|nr:uncharacterized protein LOC116853461 [Odontomachus brunneus]